jgi:hypothetical protein
VEVGSVLLLRSNECDRLISYLLSDGMSRYRNRDPSMCVEQSRLGMRRSEEPSAEWLMASRMRKWRIDVVVLRKTSEGEMYDSGGLRSVLLYRISTWWWKKRESFLCVEGLEMQPVMKWIGIVGYYGFGTQQGGARCCRGERHTWLALSEAGSLARDGAKLNRVVPFRGDKLLPEEARACLSQSRCGADHQGPGARQSSEEGRGE